MKLTKELLAQARVITKGKRILDVQRLLAQYGGQRADGLAHYLKIQSGCTIIIDMNTMVGII